MVSFNLDKLKEQLENLKQLPNIKEVVAPTPTVTKGEKISVALKKHFRYLRLIRDNFPDLTFTQIRKEFSRRRKGLESDIPDAVWQNPSP